MGKVVGEVVGHLNRRLFETAKDTGDLFRHSRLPDVEAFTKESTLLIRDYPDTVMKPANANGLPFCRMAPGKITTHATEFKIDKAQIESCVESVVYLLEGIELAEMLDA